MFIRYLIKLFIKNASATNDALVRKHYGLLGGFVGIGANLLLFIAKLLSGIVSNSVSLIADAFNNLSDMAASIVTVIGFVLAGKPPDEKHPFGYGRIEYIAGLIVSFLIMLLGYELLKTAVTRLLHPEPVSFNFVAFGVLTIAILAKLWLALFNRHLGERIDSDALKASAVDSISDAIASGCVALSLLASLLTSFPLDGIIGIIVAVIILYNGFNLIKETISPLLGETSPEPLARQIAESVMAYPNILGIHDLVIHSYGPGKYMATLHAEVPANKDIMELHELMDLIERDLAGRLGIELTLHMDPVNTNCPENNTLRQQLAEILGDFPQVISFHDFRFVGHGDHKNLIFDIVVKPGLSPLDEKQLQEEITRKIQEQYPYFFCVICVDKEYTPVG